MLSVWYSVYIIWDIDNTVYVVSATSRGLACVLPFLQLGVFRDMAHCQIVRCCCMALICCQPKHLTHTCTVLLALLQTVTNEQEAEIPFQSYPHQLQQAHNFQRIFQCAIYQLQLFRPMYSCMSTYFLFP